MKFYNFYIIILLAFSALFYSCEADISTGQTAEAIAFEIQPAKTYFSPSGDVTQSLVTFAQGCDECDYRLAGVSNMIPLSIMGNGFVSFIIFGGIPPSFTFNEQNGQLVWSTTSPPTNPVPFPTFWKGITSNSNGPIKFSITFPSVTTPIADLVQQYPNMIFHIDIRCPYWKNGKGETLKYLYGSTDILLGDFVVALNPSVYTANFDTNSKPCPPVIEEYISIKDTP